MLRDWISQRELRSVLRKRKSFSDAASSTASISSIPLKSMEVITVSLKKFWGLPWSKFSRRIRRFVGKIW